MDPVRRMIHFGLKMTEATLDRTLDVVRLVDTLLVATAIPAERETTSQEPVWPDEEQADLDALSATLRARKDDPAESTTGDGASTKAPAKKAPAKKAPAKKAPATKAPAKKSSATKTTVRKTPAKSTEKKSSATKTTARKTPAKSTEKKSSATKAPAKKSSATKASGTAEAPSLVVLPDA